MTSCLQERLARAGVWLSYGPTDGMVIGTVKRSNCKDDAVFEARILGDQLQGLRWTVPKSWALDSDGNDRPLKQSSYDERFDITNLVMNASLGNAASRRTWIMGDPHRSY